MDIITLALVFVVGLIAAFIGGVSGGGGGLLSIPALIFLGLPPQMAIATNRMGNLGFLGGTLSKFAKEKKINYSSAAPFIVLSVIGAVIGANLLIAVSAEILSKVVGVFILAMLPALFLLKDKGLEKCEPSKHFVKLGYVAYFLVAVYDGFFGAGAGLLMMYLFVLVFGLPCIESMALNQFAYLFNVLFGLAIFAFYGVINYEVGIVLLLGMVIGGYLGAHTAIKKGNRFVKLAFGLMVVVSALKLLFFS